MRRVLLIEMLERVRKLLGLQGRHESPMLLDWMKKRGSTASHHRVPAPETAKPQGRVMSGQYLLLYRYLENRYANTVVLTFAEIEDLLGFALPDQARLHQEWWTDAETTVAGPNYADSWILASRTAVPNLVARTVVFERAA
jgi:hypothetical protein